MSTTMINNDLYRDQWFFSLDTEVKFLFLFFITNPDCNLIGCYELPIQLILPHFRTTEAKLRKQIVKLEPKVFYKNG